MATITTSKATERLTARLRRNGLNLWVGISSGDSAGKYLFFKVGGSCVGGAGWTLAEATEAVDNAISDHLLAKQYGKLGAVSA